MHTHIYLYLIAENYLLLCFHNPECSVYQFQGGAEVSVLPFGMMNHGHLEAYFKHTQQSLVTECAATEWGRDSCGPCCDDVKKGNLVLMFTGKKFFHLLVYITSHEKREMTITVMMQKDCFWQCSLIFATNSHIFLILYLSRAVKRHI